MILTFGSKVVYPSQGPCLISHIVERIVGDGSLMFYQLVILNDGGGKLFIPVDKVRDSGIRPLLERSEIPKLLDHLRKPAKAVLTHKQRNIDNLKLFASGSAFDLAEVVESLTELKESKALSFGECKRLERAKSLLVCEISEVMGESKQEAEERVDKALKARSEEVKASPIIRGDLVNAFNQDTDHNEIAGQRDWKAQQAGV